MKTLWEKSPLSGSEIVETVSSETDWSQSTILTMVRRLLQKKAIGVINENVMKYYPLIEENELKAIETDQFLKRVYKGSANILVKNFLEAGRLSEKEIDELKKLLDKMK
jgi:BlaI family transcriptional regulator, penicillinase repressor